LDPDPLSFLPYFISFDGAFVLKVGVLLLLLLCSALISGAEVAFFGLSPTDINEIEEQKTTRGNIVVKLSESPKKLLATILIANNAINIGTVLLFNAIGNTIFANVTSNWMRFLLEVVIITFLILMFGEILPKVYANRNRISFSKFMAYPLKILDVVFSPLSLPMRSGTNFLYNKLGKQKSNLSVDHLSQALELTSEGDTTKEEQKILEGIVSFGNTDTKQVMRPRIDIFALGEEMKFPEVIAEITKYGYSRIPVFSENMDNVLGVLYVKDLLPYIDRKDIIEEIVGDISDEFDDEDLVYSKLDDFNYVFDGKTALKDFYRVVKIEDEDDFEEQKGESETIAGFVLEIAGNFPKKGEKVFFKNYQFLVESLDKKRLKQIKVTLPHE